MFSLKTSSGLAFFAALWWQTQFVPRAPDGGVHTAVLCSSPQTALLLSLSASKDDSVRIVVDELRPPKSRYRVPDVVAEEPRCER